MNAPTFLLLGDHVLGPRPRRGQSEVEADGGELVLLHLQLDGDHVDAAHPRGQRGQPRPRERQQLDRVPRRRSRRIVEQELKGAEVVTFTVYNYLIVIE